MSSQSRYLSISWRVRLQTANHVVREAGCGCIAELGTKVSPNCLRKHMIGVLLECFQDDSFLGNLEDCILSVR